MLQLYMSAHRLCYYRAVTVLSLARLLQTDLICHMHVQQHHSLLVLSETSVFQWSSTHMLIGLGIRISGNMLFPNERAVTNLNRL